MGSKGRLPPPHIRRPLPGPGIMHPDPYGPGIRPPPGPHPFDMLPPPEIMEHKLAAQHVEMERLATENQRLAATHAVLRQELAASQQELQRLQAHMNAMKADKDQQMRGLLDKITKMEVDLRAAEPVKMELQQARADAESLIVARQELISKVQQLTQDLQRTHADTQQIPALVSELEGLRQEYQHCRATYDYEKKLYNDYLESLQVMEKNYVTMARELEKLHAELANASSAERSGGTYGIAAGYKENDVAAHHPVAPSAYEDNYGVQQGRVPLSGGAIPYAGGPPGAAPTRAGYDAPRGPNYDGQRGPSYDAARSAGYDAARVAGYDSARAAAYDVARGPSYEAPRATGYEAQPRGGAASAGASTGAGAPPVQLASANAAAYGSAQNPSAAPYGLTQTPNAIAYGSAQTPNASAYGSSQTPTRSGGYDAPQRSTNTARRGT